MKKLTVLLVLAMLFSCCAYAEEAGAAAMQIPVSTYTQVNLGDAGWGAVEWNKTMIDEYTEGVSLGIATESGSQIGWTMWEKDYLFNVQVWAFDIDADNNTEIFVSGDIASDDYYTFCLRYENGEIIEIPFADVERGSDYEGYTEYGYGMVTGFGDNTVTLTGSQDVLGTYFGSRTFALKDGSFETADNGLWVFGRYEDDGWRSGIDIADPEIWEYRALNPVQPIQVAFRSTAGHFFSTLLPGERVIITASDCATVAYFLTEDGREGCFVLEPNPEPYAWGHLINGIPESELFEYLPYAD